MTTLAAQFREHAEQLRTSAPLYAVLMAGMAEDLVAGGPSADVLAGHEADPQEDFVQLRLLGALHRLVLLRRAPALAPYYRSVGGDADPAGAWAVARQVMADHVEELRVGLGVPPQTNEVGRSAALLVGLFDALARTGRTRVRLFELGASAGLNLRVDAYRIEGTGWAYGPADSPVVLREAVRGRVVPRALRLVERRGCDLAPVDPTTPEGRLLLTSYVWPDHVERHERLRHALAVAPRVPVAVDAASAGAWLERALDADPPGDVLTVVWHSMMAMYLPEEERARVEAALQDAGTRMTLARVAMEYGSRGLTAGVELAVATWPGAVVRRLGTVADHGIPVLLGD